MENHKQIQTKQTHRLSPVTQNKYPNQTTKPTNPYPPISQKAQAQADTNLKPGNPNLNQPKLETRKHEPIKNRNWTINPIPKL